MLYNFSMDEKMSRKVLDKLEDNLSHFLIDEFSKSDPTKRGSPEMYKYKGLNLNADPKQNTSEKTIHVRIGVLEAEFKIDSGEKNSGALAPEEERLVRMWLNRSENSTNLKLIFTKNTSSMKLAIIPFDLEHFYES